MKNKLINKKGITLIALVITIIVLLILAGISISMLAGNNGILTKATDAKRRTEQGERDERDKLLSQEALINEYGSTLSSSEIKTKTNNKIENASDNTISEIKVFGEGASAQYLPIPAGFTYKEGTIDTGAVVIDKNGNEFVWVPVDTSDTTYPMFTKTVEGDTATYTAKLWDWNSATVTISEGTGTISTLNAMSTSYKEPQVAPNGSNTNDNVPAEYNAMAKSVEIYKGFYVGRYETGIEGTKAVSKNAYKTEGVTTADASATSANQWYGLYTIQKNMSQDNGLNSVQSSMIWGSQYDAMMYWMTKTGNKITNSNYKDDGEKRNTNTKTYEKTGSLETDKINNIYDLYGVHSEWTLEAKVPFARVSRGGNYNNSESPAFRGNYGPTYTPGVILSSRLTLYIK